jgi:hypothetical protein
MTALSDLEHTGIVNLGTAKMMLARCFSQRGKGV